MDSKLKTQKGHFFRQCLNELWSSTQPVLDAKGLYEFKKLLNKIIGRYIYQRLLHGETSPLDPTVPESQISRHWAGMVVLYHNVFLSIWH